METKENTEQLTEAKIIKPKRAKTASVKSNNNSSEKESSVKSQSTTDTKDKSKKKTRMGKIFLLYYRKGQRTNGTNASFTS